jgi:hypothetical protein
VLVHAWWLAVPAVAAALGWPMSRDAHRATAAGALPQSAAGARVRITAPPMLETVTARADAPRAGTAGTAGRRDSDAAGVADESSAPMPATPRVDMPNIYILTAPEPAAPAPAARPLVRPEEFTTRIKIPGAPQ